MSLEELGRRRGGYHENTLYSHMTSQRINKPDLKKEKRLWEDEEAESKITFIVTCYNET